MHFGHISVNNESLAFKCLSNTITKIPTMCSISTYKNIISNTANKFDDVSFSDFILITMYDYLKKQFHWKCRSISIRAYLNSYNTEILSRNKYDILKQVVQPNTKIFLKGKQRKSFYRKNHIELQAFFN